MPKSSKARSVRELYRQFEKAYAECRAENLDEQRLGRAVTKCSRLAQTIATTPAADIPEILLKIRVATWDVATWEYRGSWDSLEEFDNWAVPAGTEDCDCAHLLLASLRQDLQLLQRKESEHVSTTLRVRGLQG